MTYLTKRIFLIVLAVGMLFCAGCAPSGDSAPKAQQPPKNEILADLIGKTKEEVLTVLSLEETDLTEYSLGTYMTPITVTYADVDLRLMLSFGPMEDILGGYTYIAEYTGEPERAAKEILAVAKEIHSALGTPATGAWEATEEELVTAITTEKLREKHTWYMEQPAGNDMEDYIAELAETPLYQGYQELNRKPGFLCELVLSAYPKEGADTTTASVQLIYCIGLVPS